MRGYCLYVFRLPHDLHGVSECLPLLEISFISEFRPGIGIDVTSIPSQPVTARILISVPCNLKDGDYNHQSIAHH